MRYLEADRQRQVRAEPAGMSGHERYLRGENSTQLALRAQARQNIQPDSSIYVFALPSQYRYLDNCPPGQNTSL
jgi:hypothetical protein